MDTANTSSMASTTLHPPFDPESDQILYEHLMMRDPGDYFQDVINVVFRWKEDSSKLFIQFEQKIQAYGNRIQELETMNASLKETAAQLKELQLKETTHLREICNLSEQVGAYRSFAIAWANARGLDEFTEEHARQNLRSKHVPQWAVERALLDSEFMDQLANLNQIDGRVGKGSRARKRSPQDISRDISNLDSTADSEPRDGERASKKVCNSDLYLEGPSKKAKPSSGSDKAIIARESSGLPPLRENTREAVATDIAKRNTKSYTKKGSEHRLNDTTKGNNRHNNPGEDKQDNEHDANSKGGRSGI